MKPFSQGAIAQSSMLVSQESPSNPVTHAQVRPSVVSSVPVLSVQVPPFSQGLLTHASTSAALVAFGAAAVGVVTVSPDSDAATLVMLGSEAISPKEDVKAVFSAAVKDLRFRRRLPEVVLVIWNSNPITIPATAGSELSTLAL